MLAKVVQLPWMRITHYNSPTIFDGQIGIYDYRWGNTAGYRVVDDQREDVRQVVIRHNSWSQQQAYLTYGEPVRGLVLVGRGAGADALGALHPGDRARVTWSPARTPRGGDLRQQGAAAARRTPGGRRPSSCTRAPPSASTATPVRC